MALIAVGPIAHARSFLFRAGAFVALALLLVVASLISPTFATPTNLLNVLRQMAITGVIGIGMTMVILTGLDAVGSRAILSIPIPGLVFAVLLVLGGWLLTAVPFGRYLYAIGSHEEAARLSGVKVGMQLLAVYTLCGLLSGVAGVLFAAQQSVGMALAGTGYELSAIAAVVLGGTSLFGGGGSGWGTAAGGPPISHLGNRMNLSGVKP